MCQELMRACSSKIVPARLSLPLPFDQRLARRISCNSMSCFSSSSSFPTLQTVTITHSQLKVRFLDPYVPSLIPFDWKNELKRVKVCNTMNLNTWKFVTHVVVFPLNALNSIVLVFYLMLGRKSFEQETLTLIFISLSFLSSYLLLETNVIIKMSVTLNFVFQFSLLSLY